MVRKLVYVISFVLVLSLASSAFALSFGVEVTHWTGAVSRDWMDPCNWSLGVPDPAVNANTQIGLPLNGRTPIISAGQHASTSAFDTWGPEFGGCIDIRGGTYGTPPGSSPAFIGLNAFSPPASATSVFNMGVWDAVNEKYIEGPSTYGAVEVGEFLCGDNWWGDGGYNVAFNQYSGTFVARGWCWLGGKMNLYGGYTKVTGGMNVAASGMPNTLCTLTIWGYSDGSGGKMSLPVGLYNDGTIANWIANGYLVANGGDPDYHIFSDLTAEIGRVVLKSEFLFCSLRPYSPLPLEPNDFQGKVPDINDPSRRDPCDPNIIYAAQIWTYIRHTPTAGRIIGTLYPPKKNPKDPCNPNWVFEPNTPPTIEAGFDPSKSWISDPCDPCDPWDPCDLPKIRGHEEGHLDEAQIAAREAQADFNKEIEDGTLKGIGNSDANAVKDYNDKFNKKFYRHVGDLNDSDDKYDNDTEHGADPNAQKKARQEQKNKLKRSTTQKKEPDANSATGHSCTYHPDFGLAFTDNLIEMVPDPLDPIIGAELIMPVFHLVGQTADGEFFFQAEVGHSTVEIRKDNQTYLSTRMDYILYSPTENMFYGLGMGFWSDMPEGISAYVDGVCQALISKNTLTLYGVEIYPDANFMSLTNGFTTSADCPALINSGMRIVGSGLEADLNEDYRVDFQDFAILGNQWFQAPGYPSADISPPGGDGIVNFEDLALLTSQWLEGTI
jgi:hypothetical protein